MCLPCVVLVVCCEYVVSNVLRKKTQKLATAETVKGHYGHLIFNLRILQEFRFIQFQLPIRLPSEIFKTKYVRQLKIRQ